MVDVDGCCCKEAGGKNVQVHQQTIMVKDRWPSASTSNMVVSVELPEK
jgi:hypothetical protein